jgi:starch synthase
MVSRLTAQKGFELLPEVLPGLLREDVRLCVLGSGEERYEQYFHWLHGANPGKVSFWAGYDDELSHWIEAGSDFFVMPSLYEPCGLNQMYSLRYGTLIVRRTALADTVRPLTARRARHRLPLRRVTAAPRRRDRRGLECYRDPDAWRALIRTGWRRTSPGSARKLYVELYGRLSAG